MADEQKKEDPRPVKYGRKRTTETVLLFEEAMPGAEAVVAIPAGTEVLLRDAELIVRRTTNGDTAYRKVIVSLEKSGQKNEHSGYVLAMYLE